MDGNSLIDHEGHRPSGGKGKPRRVPIRVPVNPYYIGGLGLLVAAVFVIWGYYGFNAFRSSLLQAVDREGRALLESLVQATEVTARANQYMRLQQIQILSDKASLVAAEARAGNINFAAPEQFMEENDLDGMAMLAASGEMSAAPERLIEFLEPGDEDITDAIENLRSGLSPWETIYRTDSAGGEEWIGALVAGAPPGSIYAVFKKATRIEELFRDVGIGRLIQNVGKKAGINYILLQTPEGLQYASRPVNPVLRIANDPFLVAAIAENKTDTRELIFEGQEVLETVRPFISEVVADGVIRVGLNLQSVNRAEDQLRNQLLISSIFLGLLTLAAIGFVGVRQNLSIVNRSYHQIQTLTGRILDSMDGAVVAIDASGFITHFNPAAERLFECRATDVLGTATGNLFPKDEAGLMIVSQSGTPIRDRNWQRTVDGQAQFLTVSSSPIRRPDGTAGGAVTVIVDQTESRRLAERIRRAERLSELGTMAAGVAHEVRNPLNAIALAAQRLNLEFEVKKDADEFQQFTGSILSESRRLDTIINDFLELARSPREAPEKFSLAAVLDDVTALLALEAKAKGIEFSMSGDRKIELFGIPGELKKAVINIISNAIAATPEGGSISVRYRQLSDTRQAVIQVTDTGEGIKPDDRGKIFQPYFTTKAQGTGLGLAITARVIADFNGSIDVDSTPGQGTTMEIRLPLGG